MFDKEINALKLAERTLKKKARTEEKDRLSQKKKEIGKIFEDIDILEEIELEAIKGTAILLKRSIEAAKIEISSDLDYNKREELKRNKDEAERYMKKMKENAASFQEIKRKRGRPKKNSGENKENSNANAHSTHEQPGNNPAHSQNYSNGQ